MKTLLKGGIVVSGTSSEYKDVLIEGEKIIKVEAGIADPDAEIVDVSGKLLFPGFIDAHTHFDLAVAGTVTADDFESGSISAICGGTTMVIDHASQDKGSTLAAGLKHWHDMADNKCSCDYSFHMSITEWNEETRAEIKDMIDAGVTSFKLYMTYPAMVPGDDGVLYDIIKELNKYGCFAGVHCENAGIIDALIREAKARGEMAPSSHPRVRPAEMEAEAVHRLLVITQTADAPIMIVHTTNALALAEIEEGRRRGQTVYCETCPQYLLLDDSCYEGAFDESSKYICAPPIRKVADQDALWTGIANGSVNTVATDHCSFTLKQKHMGDQDFTKIPGGVPGVEARGVILYTYGVGTGRITKEEMCAVLSENVAKLYDCYPQRGVILPGSDADIVVLDPEKEGIISADTQHSAAGYSPYEGMKLKGMIDKVYMRGTKVVEDNQLLIAKAGKYIVRHK